MDDDAWKEHPFVKKNFNDVDSVTRTLMRKATSPWWKFFDFAKFSVAEAGASKPKSFVICNVCGMKVNESYNATNMGKHMMHISCFVSDADKYRFFFFN